MMTPDQPQSETPRRKDVQDSLRLLTGINSWQLWSSVLMMVLLAGAIVLFLFPLGFAPSLPVFGLLVLGCVISGVTLHEQRHRLKLLRESLMEQMYSVIQQRAKAEKFYGMATQDALTGLYNRRFGETRLQEEIERAEKSGEPLILIAVDFDKFKQINDQHGHAAGDLALKEFSRRLQRAVRACDVPIRVGGDEFLVIFPECTLERLPEIMSRMDSIEFTFSGKKIPVSFCYGAAQYEPNDKPETMVRRADERLYAKKAKRKAPEASSASASREADALKSQEEAAKLNLSPARSLVGDAGFRRSERVPFEMPVEVYVSGENEEPTHEEGNALSVNAHGALLALSMPVEMAQSLRLVNPRTQKEMECRVCRFVTQNPTGVREVAIEFAMVAPTFWDVPSPPADWDPAWVSPAEDGCRQLSPFANAAPPVALSENAVRHLSDEVNTAMRGSAQWNPSWAPRGENQGPQASPVANAGAARPVSSPTDTMRVVWDDTETVKDISRLVGLDSTWVPQPERSLPGVSFPEKPRGVRNEANTITKEALRGLQNLPVNRSENGRVMTKPAAGRTYKWFLLPLASFVALITLWLAMPRGSSGTAVSSNVTNDARSRQPKEKTAEMASSRPSGSTASGMSQSGLPTESTGFAANTCGAIETAPTNSSTVMSRVMPHDPGFRLATKEDFDPEAVLWLQNGRQEASGGIRVNFAGSGGSWAAYLWVSEDKSWQVVVITGTRMRCDLSFQSVAIAAHVSKELIKGVQWAGPAPSEPSGDGLLIVRSAKDAASGVVLFFQGTDIVRSYPVDYRQVPLG